MKILQLVPRLPYPSDDGGKIGIAGILEAFGRLGHSVVLGGFDEERRLSEATEALRKHALDWFTEDIPASRVLRSKALVGLGLASYVREKYYSPTFARKVLTLARSWKPDLLHIDHSHMGSYGLLVKQQLPDIKVWVRAHNVESTIWERRAAVVRDPWRAMVFRRQAQLGERFESRLFEAVDGVAAITPIDATRIRRQAPGANVHLMTAGYDLQSPTVLRRRIDGELRLCFVGSLEYTANTDGLAWFIAEIWPTVRHAYPGATLVIAGRSSQRLGFLEFAPGVTYVGFVADVRSVTDNADIAIVPLRIGGGVRLKILDFMSRGMPIIATRVGAEGIPAAYRGSPTLRLADTAAEYLQQIAALLLFAEREAMANTGRRLIDERYSWTALVQEYCDAIVRGSGRVLRVKEGRS